MQEARSVGCKWLWDNNEPEEKTASAGPKIPGRPGWYTTCVNQNNTGMAFQHTTGTGPRVTRKKCEYCGSSLTAEPSYWGVIQWKQKGNEAPSRGGYTPQEVVSWHTSDDDAWEAAKARTDDGGQGGWIDRRFSVEELKAAGLL